MKKSERVEAEREFKIQNSKLSPSELEGVLRSSGGVCFGKGRKGRKSN